MTPVRQWRPVSPPVLADEVAHWLAGSEGSVRVAIDGVPGTDPAGFAAALAEPLRLRGRPVAPVDATTFWRDASLRLEYGRTDVQSFRETWLDAAALEREVLASIVRDGKYLPSLRDPVTNRSTHASPLPAGIGTVLLVSGELLLGRGLSFDLLVHLTASVAARRRRADPDRLWTVPAFDDYDRTVAPGQIADVVVKLDDPAHPAVAGLPAVRA